jgi:4-hydroxybenzoate polyprenyltransferase
LEIATVVPFSFFTIASSLEAGSSYETLLINTGKCALLSFLLLYTFTISSQINGIEEDRINKFDRPIVSGRVSLQGAYARYGIFTLGCLLLAFVMGVEAGAMTFMVLGALHNFTDISSFGPTKDFTTTGGLASGLYSAWVLGGGDKRRGINWIACLSISLLFTISIQDLRDVIGDAASGRYTTPWMLGKPYGKFCFHHNLSNKVDV